MGQGKSDASLSSTELEAIWGSLAKVLFSKTDTHTLVTKGNPVRLSGGGKLSVFELKKKNRDRQWRHRTLIPALSRRISMISRPPWSREQVRGQPGIHSKTLSHHHPPQLQKLNIQEGEHIGLRTTIKTQKMLLIVIN